MAEIKVLFLCTGNSARSIMAEAILRRLGKGRFAAFSAGSSPTGQVNPLALETLQAQGYGTEGLSSKSWEVYAAAGAPAMDCIITVCDNAAGEVCPVWPGHPAAAHWGFPDPAAAGGDEANKRAVFNQVFAQIEDQIRKLVALPVDDLSSRDAAARLQALKPRD